MTTSAHFQMTHPAEGAAGQATVLAEDVNDADFLLTGAVINRTQTSTPGSPVAGDGYIAFTGVTGWTGKRNGTPSSTFLDGDVVYYNGSGWVGWAPEEGQVFAVQAENIRVVYNGTAWVFMDSYALDAAVVAAGTIQSTATLLGFGVSRVTTSAAGATGVRLPLAEVRGMCIVINSDAADAVLVYPSAGDSINALAADASLSLAAGARAIFVCVNTVNWYAVVSA